jgi:hypothetical protein
MRDGALRPIPPAMAAIYRTNGLRTTPPNFAPRLLAPRRSGEGEAQKLASHLLALSAFLRPLKPHFPVFFITPIGRCLPPLGPRSL